MTEIYGPRDFMNLRASALRRSDVIMLGDDDYGPSITHVSRHGNHTLLDLDTGERVAVDRNERVFIARPRYR